MQQNNQLLTIGNTIVDMEYQVSEETLTELGIDKGSMTLIDAEKKQTLQNELSDNAHLCSGGSAANTLYIAKKLGIQGHHLGVIGTDTLGDFTLSDYNTEQLGHSFNTTQKDGDTGCCIVLITPDGERTMLTYLGVSTQFPQNFNPTDLISSTKLLLIEGYLLADDTCYNLLINTIIPTAQSNNINIGLTLSDSFLIGLFKERYLTILNKGLQFLFCNFDEAKALSNTSTLQDTSTFFTQHVTETIITDGSNGAHIITKTDTTTCATTPVTPIDTTGAGDSFAGTYLAERFKEKDITTAATTANNIATLVVSHMGARPKEALNSLLTPT